MTATATSLRILFVCGADFRAPSEKHVLAFCQELTRRGHAVAVSIAGDLSTVDSEGASSVSGLEVWRHTFTGRRLDAAPRRCARRFDPSLIHAFNCREPVAAAARGYARQLDAPVFVHFEDDEWSLAAPRPDEPRVRRLARPIRRLTAVAHPPLWPFATAGSLRWAARSARALDAVSPALAAHVTAMLARPCAALLPPLPGLATLGSSATRAMELPAQLEGRRLIAFTGAVFGAHVRDFRLGLEAVAALRAQGRAVAFVHAGEVAPRFDVHQLARTAGLPEDSAAFLGYLPGPQSHWLLQRAAVLIQPGYPDSFNRLRLPSKVQAYLASGTPTVTFAAGLGELLEDRVEVLKTYTSRASELADRIAEALDDEDLRRRLALGGPRAAQRLFDPSATTDALLAHYQAGLRA